VTTIMLAVGEVRTCLLHNSTALPVPTVLQLLDLVPGRRVLSAERPVAWVSSPDLAMGIDCPLAVAPQARVRGIGTVGCRALVTGGTVLQSSALTHLRRSKHDRRMPWSYYTEHAHTTDFSGPATVTAEHLSRGFLQAAQPGQTLDLDAVNRRLLATVLRRPQLDNAIALRNRQTRVRWTAVVGPVERPTAAVRRRDEVTQIIELTVPAGELGLAARFCEDFALHDWLLATLQQVIDEADRVRDTSDEYVGVLGTAIERLPRLWMPGAHLPPTMRGLWDSLDRHPGFTRQWDTQVAQVRDRVTVRTLQELQQARTRTTPW
jgi:hypothetical protein